MSVTRGPSVLIECIQLYAARAVCRAPDVSSRGSRKMSTEFSFSGSPHRSGGLSACFKGSDRSPDYVTVKIRFSQKDFSRVPAWTHGSRGHDDGDSRVDDARGCIGNGSDRGGPERSRGRGCRYLPAKSVGNPRSAACVQMARAIVQL